MIPPWGYRNLLDAVSGQAYLPTIVWSRRLTTRQFNSSDEHSQHTWAVPPLQR
jgi:hypothetical protein